MLALKMTWDSAGYVGIHCPSIACKHGRFCACACCSRPLELRTLCVKVCVRLLLQAKGLWLAQGTLGMGRETGQTDHVLLLDAKTSPSG